MIAVYDKNGEIMTFNPTPEMARLLGAQGFRIAPVNLWPCRACDGKGIVIEEVDAKEEAEK